MKKILIIGSQGYLGSRMTDYFQELAIALQAGCGFLSIWSTPTPQTCSKFKKAAQEITAEDINGHDVVIQLAGISNDPLGI